MVDDATLETNVLSFREKSFSYASTVEVEGVQYAIFYRTEVESESRFRPKVVHLKLAVPRDVILGDLASDTLVLAPDGKSAGPRRTGGAQEVDADESEFREQGIDFVRSKSPDGTIRYLPKAAAAALGPLV
jgi:hypothetical protein